MTETRRAWNSTLPARSQPMSRGNGFAPSGSLARTVPVLGAERKPERKPAARATTGFSRSVKLKVRTRAGGNDPEQALCESCGTWLGRRHGECQHLVARGMGGTSNPLLSTVANAALLCRDCHRIAESRDPGMRRKGFWLPQGTDPRMVPMTLWSGAEVWRAEDGKGDDGSGYLYQQPEARAA